MKTSLRFLAFLVLTLSVIFSARADAAEPAPFEDGAISGRALAISPRLAAARMSESAVIPTKSSVRTLAEASQQSLFAASHSGQGSMHQVPASVPGDADGDLAVRGTDFLIWQRNFGQHDGTATVSDGDFNGDGFVNASDYSVWRDHLGLDLSDTVPTDSNAFYRLRERDASTVPPDAPINQTYYDVLDLSGRLITSFIKGRTFGFASQQAVIHSLDAPDASADGHYVIHAHSRIGNRGEAIVPGVILEVRDGWRGSPLHMIALREENADAVSSVRFLPRSNRIIRVTYASGDTELYDAATGRQIIRRPRWRPTRRGAYR